MRPLQPLKAELPIFVNEFGMVIEVRPVQPEKAKFAIPLVPSFITIFEFAGMLPLYS